MQASIIGTAMALLLLIPARAAATPDAARLEHLHFTKLCRAAIEVHHLWWLTGYHHLTASR